MAVSRGTLAEMILRLALLWSSLMFAVEASGEYFDVCILEDTAPLSPCPGQLLLLLSTSVLVIAKDNAHVGQLS